MTVRYVPFLTVPTMVSAEVVFGFDRMLAGGLGSSTRAMVVSQFSTVREDLMGWFMGFSTSGFSAGNFSAGDEASGWAFSGGDGFDWDEFSLAVLADEKLAFWGVSVGTVEGLLVGLLLTIGVGFSLGWIMAIVPPAIAATPVRLAMMRAGFGRPNFSMMSSLE